MILVSKPGCQFLTAVWFILITPPQVLHTLIKVEADRARKSINLNDFMNESFRCNNHGVKQKMR